MGPDGKLFNVYACLCSRISFPSVFFTVKSFTRPHVPTGRRPLVNLHPRLPLPICLSFAAPPIVLPSPLRRTLGDAERLQSLGNGRPADALLNTPRAVLHQPEWVPSISFFSLFVSDAPRFIHVLVSSTPPVAGPPGRWPATAPRSHSTAACRRSLQAIQPQRAPPQPAGHPWGTPVPSRDGAALTAAHRRSLPVTRPQRPRLDDVACVGKQGRSHRCMLAARFPFILSVFAVTAKRWTAQANRTYASVLIHPEICGNQEENNYRSK
jgi:hypothetical protein